MRKWAVALAALWMVMGSPPVSLGAEGVTLPKDLPLPTDASVAIYLPKHIREFRNPFRSGGGFQTTNALQLGASFEELTLGAAQHFFKTSFMYEPTGSKYPSQGEAAVKIEKLIDREHPAVSGTGFFLNRSGQILTAAHVVHDCASVDVHYGKDSVAATTTANSALLDLAVLETHANSEHFLRLRDHAELAESVINVGFPLQTLMTDTPTVTRGTLSSRVGLSGSVGQFQFSAPIQPGASGGPVVDVRGNVLGVAVGTLNASELLKSGVLPQNVNFALESRYVEKFLQQHSVLFTEGSADAHAPGEVSIDEVLPAVVSIKCYQ